MAPTQMAADQMAPASLPWHAAPAHTVIPLATIIPEGIDLDALEMGLADDHVDAPSDVTPGLLRVVAEAKSQGHDMNFVVLTEALPRFTYYRDVATALQEKTGGTVVVFGPNTIGTASDDFSRVQLEQAQDNLTVSDPTVGAQQVLDRMTDQTQVPWTVITVLLVVVVTLGAVGARVLGRRRTSTGADATTPSGTSPTSTSTSPERTGRDV